MQNISCLVRMAIISVRVPEELRKEMKNSGIDWNEELRLLISERIKIERRNRAVQRLDKIRRRVKPGFDSAKSVREDRDA